MNEDLGNLRLTRPLSRLATSPALRLDPAVLTRLARTAAPTEPPAAAPAPTAPPPAAAAPAPAAAPETVFERLPFPQAGDRIRSEDFRTLSQALVAIADFHALAGTLVGRRFAEARLLLAAQQYTVERVLTVFGTDGDIGDPALDARSVLSLAPLRLGERRVTVVVSEAVDTRRVTPDLSGLTHAQALERVRSIAGDAPAGGPPLTMPDLVGLPLDAAAGAVVQQ
jgi:hypothetical protein